MTNTVQIAGCEFWFHYEDPRYPTLIVRDEHGNTSGFNINTADWTLSRACICHARSNIECVCGAWDYLDEVENED